MAPRLATPPIFQGNNKISKGYIKCNIIRQYILFSVDYDHIMSIIIITIMWIDTVYYVYTIYIYILPFMSTFVSEFHDDGWVGFSVLGWAQRAHCGGSISLFITLICKTPVIGESWRATIINYPPIDILI